MRILLPTCTNGKGLFKSINEKTRALAFTRPRFSASDCSVIKSTWLLFSPFFPPAGFPNTSCVPDWPVACRALAHLFLLQGVSRVRVFLVVVQIQATHYEIVTASTTCTTRYGLLHPPPQSLLLAHHQIPLQSQLVAFFDVLVQQGGVVNTDAPRQAVYVDYFAREHRHLVLAKTKWSDAFQLLAVGIRVSSELVARKSNFGLALVRHRPMLLFIILKATRSNRRTSSSSLLTSSSFGNSFQRVPDLASQTCS